MFGSLISAGASILSGVMGSRSADKASDAQSASSAAAIAEQKRQFDLARSDSAPWRQAGSSAITRMGDLLGLGPNASAEGYGDLNQRFTVGDFYADPVTQLGLDYGQKAIERNLGARGMLKSGAMLKSLQDYAGTRAGESRDRFYGDQDRIFNRLSGVSGTGQAMTSNTSALGNQTAGNVGDILTGAGNARGASAIAKGNAWSNAFNTIGSWWNQKNTLDRLLTNNGGASGGSSYAMPANAYDF